MQEGKIIKGIGGFYTVETEDKKLIICKARGLFRKENQKPLIGDFVRVEIIKDGEGYIQEVLPRKNQLLRPEVANVDLAVLVFCTKSPNLNLLLLDKLTVMAEHYGMEALIVFNKSDLANPGEIEELKEIYTKAGYPVFVTSKYQEEAILQLKKQFANRTSVFAGPSGVGKSTLMNRIKPGLKFETGEISEKTKRGKHTTRHSEIVSLEENGFLIDTPGFSSLEMELLKVENLKECFREFQQFASDCKFRSCAHIKEPDCGVRNALESGEISLSRYLNYCSLVKEQNSKRRTYS